MAAGALARADSPSAVVITALGAVSSVGRSAHPACAALRAGVTRPSPYFEFQVLDAATQQTVPLTAHPMNGYTDGFSLVGRWVRLARGAVSDLLGGGGLPSGADRAFWSRTGLTAVCAIPNDTVFLPDEPGESLAMIRDGFFAPLPFAFDLPIEASRMELVPAGHAGTAAGISSAAEKLARSDLDRVLVVAADSCFDPLLLEQLASQRRLKLPDNPVGLIPGEAAFCFMLERADSSARRGAKVFAALGCRPACVAAPLTGAGRTRPGAALAASVDAVLDVVSPGTPFHGDLVLDLNGEDWRANQWGSALVQLGARLGGAREWLPASSVGEVGAASGALGVCYAAHLLERRAARTDTALVVSCSDSGAAGCVALTRSAHV